MVIQRKVCDSEIKEFNEKDLSVVHFISSELPDRGGDILYAAKNDKGAGMVMFGRPVVLQQHGWGEMGMEPIAKPVSIKVAKFKDRNGIECKTQFFPDDLGKRLFKKTSEGYMPNWSVGWMPMEGKVEVKNDIRHVYEWELLEYSIVGVPMQPDAQTGEIGSFLFKMIPEEEDRFGELVGWKKDEDGAWEEKPYPNEHACRLEDPDKYIRIRRQNDKFGKGIHAIWGVQGGGKPVELQAIRFAKSKFTAAEARAWVKDHKYKCKLFEPASEKCKCHNKPMIIKWAQDVSGDKCVDTCEAEFEYVCEEGVYMPSSNPKMDCIVLSEHYIEKCSKCGKVISTCRCSSSGKVVRFSVCKACQEEEEVICQGCEKPVKYADVPESGMGYIKCPNCGKLIDQTGKVLDDKGLKEKEEKRKIEINVSNLIDPKILEEYLASRKGQKIIESIIGKGQRAIKNIINPPKEIKQIDDGEELPADPESDEDVGFVMVDADAVRKDNGTEDFVHGGHHYIFDFIPEPEIWVDQRMTDEDIMQTKCDLFVNRECMKYCNMNSQEPGDIGVMTGKVVRHLMDPMAESGGHHDAEDRHRYEHAGNHFHDSQGMTLRWDTPNQRYIVHSLDIEGVTVSLTKDQKEAFEKDIDEAIKQVAVKYGLREALPPAEPEAEKEKQVVNPPEPRKIVIFTEEDRKKAEQDRKKQLSEMLEPVAIQIEGMIKKIPEIVKEEMDRLRGKVK